MGSSIEYLTGIASMTFVVAKKSEVWEIMLVNAPADVVLFEILKNAQWTSKFIDRREQNFGFDLNRMPDTVYMIRMIFYFRPDHDLWKVLYSHLDYYPVLYRNSARKFCSPEIKDYQHLCRFVNKDKYPLLSTIIKVLIINEQSLEAVV